MKLKLQQNSLFACFILYIAFIKIDVNLEGMSRWKFVNLWILFLIMCIPYSKHYLIKIRKK